MFISALERIAGIASPLCMTGSRPHAAPLGLLLLLAALLHAGPVQAGRLTVFILAGQSNMKGHARIEKFAIPPR
jgi:hypothetical protein